MTDKLLRQENDVAWRVKVEDLKEGFDLLDVKNPHREREESALSLAEIIDSINKSFDQSRKHLDAISILLK